MIEFSCKSVIFLQCVRFIENLHEGEDVMAIINCPECGKEISDKAKKCIHCGNLLLKKEVNTRICSECGKEVSIEDTECNFCGCPLDSEGTSQNMYQSNKIEIGTNIKLNIKKYIVPITVALAVVVIGIVIYNVKVKRPKNTYNEAIALLEKGKYDEANELFSTIEGYNDVEVIQEQLKYESYAYSAINSLKEYLKNPDSYQPYEITFYSSMDLEENSADSDEGQITENTEEYPVCIMHYGAQNGFGGNTTGYAIFKYDSETKAYEFLGNCDSLDSGDYDTDDEDELYEMLVCLKINSYKDSDNAVGSIDLSRLKMVLKNDTYSTIKIIE